MVAIVTDIGAEKVPGAGVNVTLRDDRRRYFKELEDACNRVAELLAGRLPRHRPFETFARHPARRMAPWSVIQHYEIWPTPVLDFTSCGFGTLATMTLRVSNFSRQFRTTGVR